MPTITMTHFEASFVFSMFASVVLGIVTKKTDRDRLHYGLRCFGYFMFSLFAIGWLMYFGHG